MAETEIKRTFLVETAEGERSVKSLKNEINELKDALLNVEKNGEDWEKIVKQLTSAQKDLDDVTKAGKQTMEGAKDSIIGMEQEYKNLYNSYRLLTQEERNSDFGKQMSSQLNTLSERLNEAKMEAGNFKDNIGRYTASFTKGFENMAASAKALQNPMKVANTSIKALGASLKTLAANPVGAVIMGIVVAFKALKAIVDKVKQAINANEESQMQLKRAMAAFQPVIDGVKNAFDAVGKVAVNIITVFSKVFNKVRELNAAFTDFLGITKGAKARLKEQQEVYDGLAKSQNELILKEREYQEQNAKDKATVERLREEASEAENNTDKLNLLNQAKDKQAEIDAREVELAQERLRQLEIECSLTANDAEANDKLAAAKAAVAEAEAQASANARQFNKQINTVSKSVADAAKKEREERAKVVKEREDAEKQTVQNILDEIENEKKTEIQKLTEKYETEKALLEKYGKDTVALTERYEAEKQRILTENEANKIEGYGNEAFARLSKYSKEQNRDTLKSKSENPNQDDDVINRNNLDYYIGQLEAELLAFAGNEEQKLELETQYYAAVNELRQLDAEAEQRKRDKEKEDLEQKIQGIQDYATATVNLLDAVAGAWEDSINVRVKQGKISEKQGEEEFKRLKGIQIAVATINMLQGIATALSGAFTLKSGPWDYALAAIQATAIGVAGAANIAKIVNTDFNGNTSASVSPTTSLQTTANVAETTPYSYSRSLMTQQEEEQMNQPIYVSVTDINDVQNKVKVVETESTF